jgi:hypothetical protein
MITFACACGKELQTPDELAGRQIRCPACSEVQPVPGEPVTGHVEERSGHRPEQPPPRRRPVLRDDSDDDDYRPYEREPETTSGKSAWSLGLGVSSFLLLFLTGIPAVILGGLAIADINRSRGRVGGQGLAVGGIITGVIGTLLTFPVAMVIMSLMVIVPAMQAVQTAAMRMQTTRELTQLARAMQDYADEHGAFPPPAGGKNVHPKLSWRVAILPFIGEELLYEQFHLNEPWDSPHNSRLLRRMPSAYVVPGIVDPPGMTRYRVFVGKRAAFEMPPEGAKDPAGRRRKEFPDAAGTILVFEADSAVPWTKPDELDFATGKESLPRLSKQNGGSGAVMADGTVRTIDPGTTDEELRALIARDGDKK